MIMIIIVVKWYALFYKESALFFADEAELVSNQNVSRNYNAFFAL